ncbi:phage minor head protein [Mesorhizobium sp. RP14(2022)]|uniref:Phage minor head protein n=1 Tax=Mesorhizobium liriopis TaxID=2953882 RepID=A0ABT1C7P4_9HYPH|nr:phage minor head protein [Mesorhizobium liriopis]MCO6050845.1 phage minor head protein [Mesorhizobium liriopis]
MPRSTREMIEELLATYDDRLANAFLAAIDDIRNSITLRVIVERLEKGDVQGAIEAMQIDAEAFARLEVAIAEAYNSGGQATVGNLPRLTDPAGNRIQFRFGVRNPEGEAWLRDHSATLVTRIVDDQRTAIRQALTDGLARGENPRRTALDVVGRISRATNRREGGVIGLTAAQERYVASARAELASGDAAALRAYLGRERRDKRFDRTIEKAIRDGKPLPADLITRITGRYSDRLLLLRGEMLARTETMVALSKSRDDAMRQQITAGKFMAEDVTKKWRSAGDSRVRHTHRALNGKAVPMDGVFHSPSGAVLRHPGDPQAPVSEISGCRCWLEYKVDHLAGVVRRNRAA